MSDDGRLLFDERAQATRRFTQFAVGACVLAAACMVFGVAESMQLRVQDAWYAVRGSRDPSPQVAIVGIDGRALNAVDERWPWPRDVYAPLIERLHESGAKVIGFDIAFSRTTEQDDVFMRAMQQSRRVVFGMVFNNAGDRSPPSGKSPAYVESHAVPRFDASFLSIIPAPGLEPPAPQLAEAAAAVGHVVLLPSSDGTVRRVPTLIQHGDRLYPALALQVARVYADVPLEEVQVTDSHIRVGYADVPITHSGEALINWTTRNLDTAFPTYSVADVLRGEVGKDELGGKAILVGMMAEGLDDREFPFGMTLPGVILHAAFLDNFFTLNFLEVPGWGIALQFGAFLALAIVAIVFFPRMPTPVLLAAAPMLILAVFGLSLYLFITKSVWWPPLYPVLAVAFPFGTTVFFKLRSAEKGKKVEEARVREARDQMAEAVLEKGLAFQEKGSLDLANATFAKLPMNEEMKTIYLNLGLDYQNRRKLDQALHCYKRVYDLDAGFADVASRIEALRAAGAGTPLVSPKMESQGMGTVLAPPPQRTVAVSSQPGGATPWMSADDEATTLHQVGTGASARRLLPATIAASVGQVSNAVELPPGSPGSRYRLIRTLGMGAMGEVTLMEDSKLDRKVAIKMMRPDVRLSPRDAIEMRHRFVREAKTTGKLTHPNIVTIYDSFEGEDGVAYIVMEYVDGGTLTSFMKAGGLSVPQIKHVIINASKGLQHAHEHGVFHRDVKPDNIMVSPTGLVKVMDFGIARVVESNMTVTGSVLGTPAYMSPEQVSGQEVDARSDIFSLGVLLFELLVGKRPFTGSTASEMMLAVVQKDPPAPSTIDPAREVSPEWDPIVLTALSKQPERRYQSASEFAEAVQQCRAR